MPASLADLLSERATTTITIGKATLTLTFNPAFYSREVEAKLNAANRGEHEGDATTAQQAVLRFLQLVTAWDVLGPDKKPIPLTEEGLAPIPTRTLNDIYLKVLTEAAPGKEPSEGSP